MAKDIFREQLHPMEGIQEFEKQKAQNRVRNMGKSGKRFCVVKDRKPTWRGIDWKQTYSIQRKDKMKKLKIKC